MPRSAPRRSGLAVLAQDIVLRLQQMRSAPPGRGDRAALPSHLAADREIGRLRSACRTAVDCVCCPADTIGVVKLTLEVRVFPWRGVCVRMTQPRESGHLPSKRCHWAAAMIRSTLSRGRPSNNAHCMRSSLPGTLVNRSVAPPSGTSSMAGGQVHEVVSSGHKRLSKEKPGPQV